MARGKRQSIVPADETKAMKFTRLANQRINRALSAIKALGNLGSPSYERTSEQIAKLASVLQTATEDMVANLSPKDGSVTKEKMPDVL